MIFRALAEGGVIFSTVDEVYFGLNTVGARVWELLPPVSATFGDLVTTVAADYPDVDLEMIRADVAELLAELEQHGLVVPAPGAGSGSSATASEPVAAERR